MNRSTVKKRFAASLSTLYSAFDSAWQKLKLYAKICAYNNNSKITNIQPLKILCSESELLVAELLVFFTDNAGIDSFKFLALDDISFGAAGASTSATGSISSLRSDRFGLVPWK